MDPVIRLRRDLHRHPELSGEERETARRIVRFFEELQPDRIVTDLGGHGVAAIFEGREPGPTVMFRAELDALPVRERNACEFASVHDGVGHQCGHDGHMAILAALGTELARERQAGGRAALLFQPAEETGKGAASVLADPAFDALAPDFAFALHNLPGYPLGQVILRAGAFNCASRGLSVRLVGRTAHAAQPETGVSPARAMCRIVDGLSELGDASSSESGAIAFATVVGSRLGERAFGTAPGEAEVFATLRAGSDEGMRAMIEQAEALARAAAARDGLEIEIDDDDVFEATTNDADAVEIVRRTAGPDGDIRELEHPLRWSEDFGRFTARTRGALFGIGAGTEAADLHDPHYEFPEALIPIGARLFRGILDASVRSCLEKNEPEARCEGP